MTKDQIDELMRENGIVVVGEAVYRLCNLVEEQSADALRARLAQPEPEPFEYWNAVEGWVTIEEVRQHFDTAGCGTIYKHEGEGRVPLYAAPPKKEWVGLTNEDKKQIEIKAGNKSEMTAWEYAQRVGEFTEAKLREKNND